MRRARVRSEMPRVALVGYTNAGKSTLFNALTGADAYAADKLFATLDPTVRRIEPARRQHHARRTRSASSATCRTNWSPRSARPCPKRARPTCCCTSSTPPIRCATSASRRSTAVLQEIGAGDIPQVLVYNKIDRIEDAQAPPRPAQRGPRTGLAFGARRPRPGPAAGSADPAPVAGPRAGRAAPAGGARRTPALAPARTGRGARRNPRRGRLASASRPVPGRRPAPGRAGRRRTAARPCCRKPPARSGWRRVALAHHGQCWATARRIELGWDASVSSPKAVAATRSTKMVGQGPPYGCFRAQSTLSSRIRPATALRPRSSSTWSRHGLEHPR